MASYPFENNPWDDNTNTGNITGQPTHDATIGAGGGSGGSYYDSYNTPSYGAGGWGEPQQYQYQTQQPSDQAQEQQQEQQQQQQYSDQPQGRAPEPSQSLIGKFLRNNVPMAGKCMDAVSILCTPLINVLFQHVNKDLLVSKMFYFFFYSAFGSLFPLMGVYFKQQGMNPFQVGILTGVRPVIEIFSAPFWNSIAARFDKSKALLLFSLISWIVFTISLAGIRPPASACVAFNETGFFLYTAYSNDDLMNVDAEQLDELQGPGDVNSASLATKEVYMKPNSDANKDRENKGEILAKEETQDEQRRRRKRQVPSYRPGSRRRLAYTIGYADSSTPADDAEREKSFNYDIDLENDFDDTLVSVEDQDRRVFTPHGVGLSSSSSNYDDENEESEPADDTRAARLRRSSMFFAGQSDDQSKEPEEGRMEKSRDNEASNESDENDLSDESDVGEGENSKDGEKESRLTKTKHNQQAGEVATTPISSLTQSTTSSDSSDAVIAERLADKARRVHKERDKTPPTHRIGMSPITVEYAVNYNKDKHSQFVTPMFSTIVYKLEDVKEVFFLLLLLISLGEFFSAPALTLADSATLGYLGDNTDAYGRQRMFGSLSWAITLLLVGMALDNSTSIADHPCGPHHRERSYKVCFLIFTLLMVCAFLTATQFRFVRNQKYTSGGTSQTLVTSATENNKVVTTTMDSSRTGNIDDLYASTQPRSIFNTAPPVNAPENQGEKEKFEFLDRWKSAVFAQRTRELPEWINVFRQFKNTLHLTYLFITWFLGCGVGLVFTFLFWHLQDVGGTPTLFGICSVINHISEILAYFFSFNFIKRFGHTRVLSVGLGCNVIRFIYVAFLTNPYYALPFELVQGITHAACFAACCSTISRVSKPELRTSTQGVMQGLHHGIGRACGALIGGYIINAIGSKATFCIYGILSGCVLAGFLYVRKRTSQTEEDDVKVDDNEAFGGMAAPQGVPSALPGKLGGQNAPIQEAGW